MEEGIEDGLDFHDLARLEKLKALAVEWEAEGDAEHLENPPEAPRF